MYPKFQKKIVTAPLSDEDVQTLLGNVHHEDGTPYTAEEIKNDSSMSKVTHCRDIDTGEMKLADEKHNATGIPFFVMRASR